MSNLEPGTFSKYSLTDTEEYQGQLLTPLNRQVLQNYMASHADHLIATNLPASPEQLEEYRNMLLYHQAAIRVVRELLAFSDAAENYFAEARNQAAHNAVISGNIYDHFKPTQE